MVDVLVKFKKSDLVWLRKEAKENNRTAADMCQQLIHLHVLGLFDYKYKFKNYKISKSKELIVIENAVKKLRELT